jgi:hypothetical protein
VPPKKPPSRGIRPVRKSSSRGMAQLAGPEPFRSCCILGFTLLAQALMGSSSLYLSNLDTIESKVREKVFLVCYHAATQPSYH